MKAALFFVVLVAGILGKSEANSAQCANFASCRECTMLSKSTGLLCSWCPYSGTCQSLLTEKCAELDIREVTKCPTPRIYDDGFSRNKMLPLSAAAYSDAPQPCLTNALSGAQLRRQITLQCDAIKNDLCSGFTAVSQADKAIIIAYRGSQGFLQLVSEGAESLLAHKVPFVAGGNVSQYFYDAFDKLWTAGMRDDFLSLKNQNPTYDLWITGHSLGGSMAAIAAGTIIHTNLFSASKTKLVTFGQPRTGDHGFSAAIDNKVSYVYRVTHADDLVPHIPPKDLEGYYHHHYEIWYNNDMSNGKPHIECIDDDGSGCSALIPVAVNIQAHLHYFNHMVSEYGKGGCVGNTI